MLGNDFMKLLIHSSLAIILLEKREQPLKLLNFFSCSTHEIHPANNVKMLAIVGILTFY